MFSDFIQKLMIARQLNFSEGRFEMLGIRGVIIPAFTFSKFIEELYDEQGDDAFDALFDIGKAHGKLGVEQVGERHNMGKTQFFEKIIESGNIMGLGKASVARFDKEKKTAVITLEDSPLKKEFEESTVLRGVEPPIDHFQRGVFHAMTAKIFEADVESREETCTFAGDEMCRFRYETT